MRALALLILLTAPALAGALPGPAATQEPSVHASPPAVPTAPHSEPRLPEDQDVPATPLEGVFRVTVLLDQNSWGAHADPEAWVRERFDVVGGYFLHDHGIRLVLCRIAPFWLDPNEDQYLNIRQTAYEQADDYWKQLSVHTGAAHVDALGGECEGPWKRDGQPNADLLAVLVGRSPLYCNGVQVGGCAQVNGGFSMSIDYSAVWGAHWGDHATEHIVQHELSHNFGARDNECQYGVMDYDHTYQSHDWCTLDEVRMSAGKHHPRPILWGLRR